jgi:hypothetical protein
MHDSYLTSNITLAHDVSLSVITIYKDMVSMIFIFLSPEMQNSNQD